MEKKYIKTLEAFMEAWKEERWRVAAILTQITWKNSKTQNPPLNQFLCNKEDTGISTPAEALKTLLVSSIPKLLKYKIKGHKSISNVTKDIKVDIEYEDLDKTIRHKSLVARLICEEAPMMPSPKGKWGVNPVSLFTKRR